MMFSPLGKPENNMGWKFFIINLAVSIGFAQIPVSAENVPDYNFFDLVKIFSLHFGRFFQPVWSG